ncbi:hypothetical protein MMC18_007688 [Xylographa bjoerkii]|nr:hypothetical protein [Xylographa bjoerkii]
MLGTILEEFCPNASVTVIVICLGCLLLDLSIYNLALTALNVVDTATAIRRKALAFCYLFGGASMIDTAYLKANGAPFVIYTPGKQNIMVTSANHIRELNEAPRHLLSLHAVAKDFLQPKYTMHGFEWKDQRGIEGTGFVRALRTLLTSNLPKLVPILSLAIESQFELELSKQRVINGYRRMPVYNMAKILVTRTNSVVFFGADLAQNQHFLEAALSFPEDVSIAAEALRILPNYIGPLVAKLITRGHRSSTVLYRYLRETVDRRLEARNVDGLAPQTNKPNDGIQWMIDTSPKANCWSADRLVGEIMGTWYGSVHTLAIATTYALADLYSHQECIKPLRDEIQGPAFHDFQNSADGLPLLDSFLKESARLSAFESTGVRRQALSPFTFSDGLHIPKGDWVCVPHRSMMRDSQNFENPLEFDAFRALGSQAPGATKTAKLTEASDRWLVWGAGRILCPGRFYATLVLKLITAHLLQNYECTLDNIKGSRSVQWRSAIIPKSNIVLRIKARDSTDG